jgi:hypothetical protein
MRRLLLGMLAATVLPFSFWFFLSPCSWLPLALAGQAPAFKGQPSDIKQNETDEQKLKAAKVKTDGPALLEFLKSRTLSEEECERVDATIAQLGSSTFKVRAQASQDLIAKGPGVLELLRQGQHHPDLEVQRRCEACVQKIKENDEFPDVAGAAVRQIGVRKPAGAVEGLLGYLPFAEDESVADDVRDALVKLALQGGKVDKALADALTDKKAVRRAAAGQAIALAGAAAEHQNTIRGLLSDADTTVRYRVATALVMARDKDAVPAMIDLLPQSSQSQAWQIEDILFRLADGKAPPSVPLGDNEAGREKCRDAWRAWWQQNASVADLAVLRSPPRLLGRTTLILLDLGRIVDLEGSAVRWQMDGLILPLDVQLIDDDRILIAEHGANRVTERDLRGNILWEYRCQEPQVAQRLANKNTFIASKYAVIEVNPARKQAFGFNVPLGEGIMKCTKLPSGEIAALLDSGRVVRWSPTGKELGSFNVGIGQPLFGGRLSVLPSGRVLVPHHAENKVVEYDRFGKVVWQVKVQQPIVAARLPDGNTLVTSMTDISQGRAVEFDRYGNEVWQYSRMDSRVTRAIRR